MQEDNCSKCGSAEVIPDVFVLDRGDQNTQTDLAIAVRTNPDAWLFKGDVRSNLKARVCGSCGFTEFYATDPKALLAAYRGLT
jgi:predicted nucleic-acid-binding Zn-ribbon protein